MMAIALGISQRVPEIRSQMRPRSETNDVALFEQKHRHCERLVDCASLGCFCYRTAGKPKRAERVPLPRPRRPFDLWAGSRSAAAYRVPAALS